VVKNTTLPQKTQRCAFDVLRLLKTRSIEYDLFYRISNHLDAQFEKAVLKIADFQIGLRSIERWLTNSMAVFVTLFLPIPPKLSGS
jgi:hypothetical protein